MAKWKNGPQVASVIRLIIGNFQKSRIDFTWKKPEIEPIQKQKVNIEQNKNDENDILHNISKEEHLASTYCHYLASTMRLKALQEQYKGGERSLEESARLVGLKMPASKCK